MLFRKKKFGSSKVRDTLKGGRHMAWETRPSTEGWGILNEKKENTILSYRGNYNLVKT